ncbi:alanine/glycine:cation symporter family protein [candidate division KSB1 bacterium]
MGEYITAFSNWVWGYPMLGLLGLIGIAFTILLKGLQFTQFFKAAKMTYVKRTGKGEGNISPLQSLYGALGGIIGNGNLAGAATAIVSGGAGALFWMWIASIVAMIIVYTETFLALNDREKSDDGTYSGGPMYYIQKSLNLKWLAILFAFAMGTKTLLATTIIQSNSIADAARSVIGVSWFPGWIPELLPYCLILAFLTWLVVIGGLRSIARALEKITPLMVVVFMVFGTIIIIANSERLLEVINQVVVSAFRPQSIGGGVAGASVMLAIRFGVARGFYSNEAGTGSSPIMYCTAKTDNIYYQSLIGMFGVFIDTVVSTFTCLTILLTAGWIETGEKGIGLTTYAFDGVFPGYGGYIVLFASFLFGYSTLIAWCFYGEQCFAYIWGPHIRKTFRWAFSIVILVGFYKVQLIWSWADILNAITVSINLVALVLLINKAVQKTNLFRSEEISS